MIEVEGVILKMAIAKPFQGGVAVLWRPRIVQSIHGYASFDPGYTLEPGSGRAVWMFREPTANAQWAAGRLREGNGGVRGGELRQGHPVLPGGF